MEIGELSRSFNQKKSMRSSYFLSFIPQFCFLLAVSPSINTMSQPLFRICQNPFSFVSSVITAKNCVFPIPIASPLFPRFFFRPFVSFSGFYFLLACLSFNCLLQLIEIRFINFFIKGSQNISEISLTCHDFFDMANLLMVIFHFILNILNR